jgi:hypothetical protein
MVGRKEVDTLLGVEAVQVKQEYLGEHKYWNNLVTS